MVYRLTGPGGGEWTQLIEHGTCRTLAGGSSECDVLIEGQMEELVSASQGRAAPWVGGFARLVDWIRGPSHTEDVVALITGVASLAWAARLKRSIRVSGDSALADRLDHCFWHFWQRTGQTQYNIARG